MPTYISFLRGINVSGQKKIIMADLARLYEGLGFTNVQTYIQSGNVIFTDNKNHPHQKPAQQIEAAILSRYRFSVPVLVRTGKELQEAVAGNPFLQEPGIDPAKLHLTMLQSPPPAEYQAALAAVDCSPDRFIIKDLNIYVYCPGGYGKTKLTNSFLEKKLKVTATTRNWRTVQQLVALAGDL